MYFVTSEELDKIATMKLTITGFTTKLENFLNETNTTDDNLLRLFSNVTDLIQSFNLAAKVIKTDHKIESIMDKRIWTCENIFKCLVCNFETGKTYISVLDHINSTMHIALAKQFEMQNYNTIAITPTTSNPINPFLRLPENREFEMNMLNDPFPHFLNQLSNIDQQPFTLPLPQTQEIVAWSHEHYPIQGDSFDNFGTNSNTHHFQNYSQYFQMPSPKNVIGFQQNISSAPNNYRLNLNQRVAVVLNCLHPNAISFLRGNNENDVEEFINAAKEISSDDLYTNIKTNLADCCRELNVNAEITCLGSRITGIASRKTNINLNISVANSSQTAESFLQELFKILSKNLNWNHVKYFISYPSNTPLIRAFNFNERVFCEVSFNDEIGMASTKLIKYFYRIQPESRKLFVFVKMLFKKSKTNPRFNNYTINLLVFFYLQSEGYLPKVVDLIEASTLKHSPNEFTEKTLDELNLKPIKTFNELCVGFVKFYYYLVDFRYDVLSIFTGTKIPKSHLIKPDYRSKHFERRMCVQDPFNHGNNVSAKIGNDCLMLFRECCRATYKVLQFESVRENNSST